MGAADDRHPTAPEEGKAEAQKESAKPTQLFYGLKGMM